MSEQFKFRANVTLFCWCVGGLVTAFFSATALYWQVQAIDKELKRVESEDKEAMAKLEERMNRLESACGKRDEDMQHIQIEFQKVKAVFHPPNAMDWNFKQP